MTKSKLAAALAIATLFVGGFAALAYALDTENSAEAKADFCESLEDLSTTVMSYEGIDPLTATNDELESAADDIDDAWNEVQDDADDWANAYDNELGQAYDDLYWEIQTLPATTRSRRTSRPSRTSWRRSRTPSRRRSTARAAPRRRAAPNRGGAGPPASPAIHGVPQPS